MLAKVTALLAVVALGACGSGPPPIVPPPQLTAQYTLQIRFDNRLPNAVSVTRYWSTKTMSSWHAAGTTCVAGRSKSTTSLSYSVLDVAAIPGARLHVDVKSGTTSCGGASLHSGNLWGPKCTVIFPGTASVDSKVTLRNAGGYTLSNFQSIGNVVPICAA